jgi:putative aminopeptidase FrvX
MADLNLSFLKTLLNTPGPSGDEAAAARVWRDEARTFADQVYADVRGNSYALLEGSGARVLLAGHIDEIGLMISYIDDDGYLFFAPVGGWDAQVLVGQRVRLLGHQGEVVGVVGKKPIHMMKSEERDQVSKIENLWIDIGVKSRDEALERVRVGSVGVIDAPLYELPHGRIVSRSLDNRIGAFTVLEALRRLSQDRPTASVAAVATTQEETSLTGATTAAFRFDPHISIVVDVTFATDHPETDKRQFGDVRLGGGPVLSRGAANSPLVHERLVAIAERESIPYSLQITPRYTGTDADAIHLARGGVATGVISIPNRYMHSPNEMIDLTDVDHAARLIAAFAGSIKSENEFLPE